MQYHGDTLDKDNTEGNNTCVNFNYTVYIKFSFLDLPQSSRISRMERPENSVVCVTVYLSLIRGYLLRLNGIFLGQRTFTSHENLLRKSCFSCL